MEKYLGESMPKLGFGLMRLPMDQNHAFDMVQLQKMVDLYLERGFRYFDTAFGYYEGRSEEAAKKVLFEQYPRDRITFATKLPTFGTTDKAEFLSRTKTSLERSGCGYIDYYLLHCVFSENKELFDRFGAWDWMMKLKRDGVAKHIGFSFHDSPEFLDQVLSEHPEMEFVQLQINYADWEDPNVASRRCYEVARKHHKPVVVMEPVKGGMLSGLTQKAADVFRNANPDASVSSWAVRFAASLEGVITVLSGMSSLSQVEDNTSFMKPFTPLNDAEKETVLQVRDILKATDTIPCTACRYCADACPQQIPIPDIFGDQNLFSVYGALDQAKRNYHVQTKDTNPASACLACGACEQRCPQHIKIIETLKKAAELLE